MSEANVKKNTVGENLILVGIILHILNIVAVLLGFWGDMSKVVLILFVIATIPYIIGYIYMKKAPTLWGYIFIPISLFFTHYIAALFFVIGSIVTIKIARNNKHMLQKQHLN